MAFQDVAGCNAAEFTSLDNIKESLQFLSKYQWVYDFQLIHFLRNKIWQHIPLNWVECLTSITIEELNQIPYGYTKNTWPPDLRKFIDDAQKFTYSRMSNNSIVEPIKLKQHDHRGMKPKKKHEVSHMASVVHSVCKASKCSDIVDVGAGLGYLSHSLQQQYGYRVLTLECQESRSHGAEARAAKLDLSNITSAIFHLENDPESFSNFEELIRSTFVLGNSFLVSSHQKEKIQRTKLEKCQQDSTGKVSQYNAEKSYSNYSTHSSAGAKAAPSVHTDTEVFKQNTCTALKINSDDSTDVEQNSKPVSQCNCVKTKESSDAITIPFDETGVKTEAKEATLQDGDTGYLLSDEELQTMSKVNPVLSSSVCMIGLHCCGPLTPTMLKYFIGSSCIKSFVCVSCCYHSMPVTDSNECTMFPMSQAVGELYKEHKKQFPQWKMSTYALRLAAQETRARWRCQSEEDHAYHKKNVGYRALLDLISQQDKSFVKLKRRLARRKDYVDFDTYLNAVFNRTTLGADRYEKIKLLHQEHDKYFQFIEPLTVLQVMLQPVLETLIYVDRILFLKEHGIFGTVVPIFDENISPRNLAIIAVKE